MNIGYYFEFVYLVVVVIIDGLVYFGVVVFGDFFEFVCVIFQLCLVGDVGLGYKQIGFDRIGSGGVCSGDIVGELVCVQIVVGDEIKFVSVGYCCG